MYLKEGFRRCLEEILIGIMSIASRLLRMQGNRNRRNRKA